MKRRVILFVLLILLEVFLVSVVTTYLIVRPLVPGFAPTCDNCVRFVSEPRPDNPDHGYLQIDGERYLQLYTTTQVEEGNIPPGSHYHRIDVLGGK